MADYLVEATDWTQIWTGRNETRNGRRVTASRLLQLYNEGIWTEQELLDVGVRPVTTEQPPDGQRDIPGTRGIVEENGQLIDRAQYEPIPPEPVLTPAEKYAEFLADYELTEAEFRQLLGLPARGP